MHTLDPGLPRDAKPRGMTQPWGLWPNLVWESTKMTQRGSSLTEISPLLSTENQTPFNCERFRLFIRVTSLMVLPPYKGGVFRGAFGYTFRRVVCAVRNQECPSCILRDKCLYVNLFEPTPPAGFPDARKYPRAPAPFIIRPPETHRQAFHAGETLEFELILLGPALEALPYFIYTLVEMGKRGLGRERGKYQLTRADWLNNGDSLQVYDGRSQTLKGVAFEQNNATQQMEEVAPEITLKFITPIRLKQKGRLVTRLTFPLLIERLIERITLLSAFYGSGTPAGLQDLQPLSEHVKTAHDSLYWYDWGRYSTRQKDYMKLGGLRGEITFKGDLWPFMPLLRLGEKVHVGQGTGFGLGRFEVGEVI